MLIKNGNIYTMAQGVIEAGDILIEDGRIIEIGKDLDPKGREIIDVSGKMVLPGFIDAHCHLGMDEDSIGFEGSDVNEYVDPITSNLDALDGFNPMDRTLEEAYRAGVTSVNTGVGSANVIGGSFVALKTYGKRADDMVIKSPTAIKVAFGENPKRVYKSQKKSPVTRMATAGLLRENLFKAERYLALKEAGKADYDPKLEALLPVIRREIPLKAHAHREDDIFTAIRIAKEFNIRMTLDHCTSARTISEDLAKEGYPCIVGPSLGHRGKLELKGKSFKTAGVLCDAGLKIAITTDSPVIPVQHLGLCAAYAVADGLDEMEALKAITINPAEIIGISDRVGSLEVGKDADLLICEGHPLRDFNYRVLYTIIDGKIVHKLD